MSVAAPPRPPRRDERQALIEEARRRARRRRRGYAGLLLVVLGAGLGLYFGGRDGGGSRGPEQRGAGPAARGPAEEARRIAAAGRRTIIGEAGLVGANLGWAMNGLALWWTRDGGRHWRTIAPPQVRAMGDVIARVTDVAAVDDDHIWVAAADIRSGSGLSRHMAIERTRDGGRNWRSVIPPDCGTCGAAHLSFVDASHGFALLGPQPSARLFETRDGGVTWRRVNTNVSFAGPVRFVTDRTGWAVSDPGGVVYTTGDGGRHWRRVALARPTQYRGQRATVGVPRFFDTRDGVVPVRFRNRSRAQHLVVYVTRDGGATWTARAAPHAIDLRAESWRFPQALPFSAATIDDWFVFANRDLYTTHDGGRTWSAFRTVAPKPPRVWDVAFASPTYGWAIFASALVKTTDGGRHWAPLAPH